MDQNACHTWSQKPQTVDHSSVLDLYPAHLSIGPVIQKHQFLMLVYIQHVHILHHNTVRNVPVHVATDLTEEQRNAFRIMDNKSSEAADWDNELLSKEFQKLAETDFDMLMTGFDDKEIAKLTSDMLEFQPPEDVTFEEGFAQMEELQPSNVKMVNLFLNQDNEPVFQEMVARLKEQWGKDNLTDTVYDAVKQCYENSES